MESGDAQTAATAATQLGDLLKEQGDRDGAREAYRKAMESGDAQTAATAATQLGDLLKEQGDRDGAREAYRRAMESGDAQTAATAATQLGDLLKEQGDRDGARNAYHLAIEARRRRLVFANVVIMEPGTLADVLRRHWREARRLLAGQRKNTPQFLALLDWARTQNMPEAVRILERYSPPERLLVQLLLVLDPQIPPEFRGQMITPLSLLTLAHDAAEQDMVGEAADLLDTIYRDGILTIFDAAAGCDGYALLDDRWHRLVQALEDRFTSLHVGSLNERESRMSRAVMLKAALVPDEEGALARQAEQALSDQDAESQQWFRDLHKERFEMDLEPARYQLIVMMKGRAAEQTANARRAEQLREA